MICTVISKDIIKTAARVLDQSSIKPSPGSLPLKPQQEFQSPWMCKYQKAIHVIGSYCIRGHPFMTSTWRGSGSGGRMWTGGRGPAPCGRPHRKLKLESTDVILSSSHAKKLMSFLSEFHLWTEKKWKFSCDIN